jgi:hypothetical protein
VKAKDGYHLCGGMYQLKDLSVNLQQFHQENIGFPEDGASNAPKHVGARLYTRTNYGYVNAFCWSFIHRMKNEWSKLQNVLHVLGY